MSKRIAHPSQHPEIRTKPMTITDLEALVDRLRFLAEQTEDVPDLIAHQAAFEETMNALIAGVAEVLGRAR